MRSQTDRQTDRQTDGRRLPLLEPLTEPTKPIRGDSDRIQTRLVLILTPTLIAGRQPGSERPDAGRFQSRLGQLQ